jgi:Spy/CpxP family protein refolding chaperone
MLSAPRSWPSLRVVSTLAAVFLAGASAGALTMRFGLHQKLHQPVAMASREPSRELILQNFKTQLDLTAEQFNEIAMVLEDYRHYYQSLQDQLDDLQATGRNRIVQLLDPKQRAKFEKLVMDLGPQLGSGRN